MMDEGQTVKLMVSKLSSNCGIKSNPVLAMGAAGFGWGPWLAARFWFKRCSKITQKGVKAANTK